MNQYLIVLDLWKSDSLLKTKFVVFRRYWPLLGSLGVLVFDKLCTLNNQNISYHPFKQTVDQNKEKNNAKQ